MNGLELTSIILFLLMLNGIIPANLLLFCAPYVLSLVITPIIIGDGKSTMEFSKALFSAGVMATGIAFPTVQEGKARIRTIVTSEHSREQLDEALETLVKTAKQLQIL